MESDRFHLQVAPDLNQHRGICRVVRHRPDHVIEILPLVIAEDTQILGSVVRGEAVG